MAAKPTSDNVGTNFVQPNKGKNHFCTKLVIFGYEYVKEKVTVFILQPAAAAKTLLLWYTSVCVCVCEREGMGNGKKKWWHEEQNERDRAVHCVFLHTSPSFIQLHWTSKTCPMQTNIITTGADKQKSFRTVISKANENMRSFVKIGNKCVWKFLQRVLNSTRWCRCCMQGHSTIHYAHTHKTNCHCIFLRVWFCVCVCVCERKGASQAPLRRCHPASKHSSAASNDT